MARATGSVGGCRQLALGPARAAADPSKCVRGLNASADCGLWGMEWAKMTKIRRGRPKARAVFLLVRIPKRNYCVSQFMFLCTGWVCTPKKKPCAGCVSACVRMPYPMFALSPADTRN